MPNSKGVFKAYIYKENASAQVLDLQEAVTLSSGMRRRHRVSSRSRAEDFVS